MTSQLLKFRFITLLLLMLFVAACGGSEEPATVQVDTDTVEAVPTEVVEPTEAPADEVSAETSTEETASSDSDEAGEEPATVEVATDTVEAVPTEVVEPTEAPADEVSAETSTEETASSESEEAGTDEGTAEAVADEAIAEVEMMEEQTIIRTFTTGIAQNSYAGEVTSNCTSGVDYRTGNMGEVTDDDGNVWIVPADVAGGFTNVEVYNDCFGDGDNPDFESELVTQVIDEGGTEITGYIFADNYYEMYVNGVFTGRDSVNFTTFNSHAVKFQAEYPITYAFRLVDWEEYNGVGMEELRGYHAGDGGFIANFSDGASTNDDWVCKPFYISPLDDGGSCVVIDEHGNADASACPSSDDAISCIADDPEGTCGAYHETVPDGWMNPDFDDSTWPAATRYVADDITNQVGFRNYEDTLFANTNFIWSSNLVLDNSVICRMTVEAP